MTTKEKITFLDRLFVLVKKKYFSKKEMKDKEGKEEAILSKLDSL